MQLCCWRTKCPVPLQFWQLYNSVTLFRLAGLEDCKEWQVRCSCAFCPLALLDPFNISHVSSSVTSYNLFEIKPIFSLCLQVLMLALTFLVLFLGNFLTTLKVVRQKVHKNQEKVEKNDWGSKTVPMKQGTEDFFFFFFSETKGFCQQHAQSLDGTDWSPIGLKGKCSRHFSRASTAAGAASCWPIGTGGYFLFLLLNQFFNNSFMSLLAPSRATVCCFYRVHSQNEREWKAVFLTAPTPSTTPPSNPPRRLCQYMNLSASWGSIHLQLKVRGGSRDMRQRWLSEQIHTLPFKTKRLSQNMLHTSVK